MLARRFASEPADARAFSAREPIPQSALATAERTRARTRALSKPPLSLHSSNSAKDGKPSETRAMNITQTERDTSADESTITLALKNTQTEPVPIHRGHLCRLLHSISQPRTLSSPGRVARPAQHGGRGAHLGRGRRASNGACGARAHLSLLNVAPARNSGRLRRRACCGLRLLTWEQNLGRSTCHEGE